MNRICRSRIALAALLLTAAAACAQSPQLLQPANPAYPVDTQFGRALAANTRELAVGAPAYAGYVQLYARDASGWTPTRRIDAPAGSNEFGYAVAMSEHWLAIGARDYSQPDSPSYLYLYRRDAEGWTFVERRGAPTASGYLRAIFLKLSDTALVVSEDRWLDDVNVEYFVHVAGNDGNGWGAFAVLPKPAGSSNSFGFAVAAADELLLVSDPGRAGGGTVSSFVRSGTQWTEASRLPAPSEMPGGRFGRDVAICGDRIVVHRDAAAGESDSTPRLAVFRGSVSAPTLERALRPTEQDNYFGAPACSGATLVADGGLGNRFYGTSLNDASALPVWQAPAVPLRRGNLCFAHAASRGDLICSASVDSGLSPPASNSTGIVYVYNDAVDLLFASSLD